MDDAAAVRICRAMLDYVERNMDMKRPVSREAIDHIAQRLCAMPPPTYQVSDTTNALINLLIQRDQAGRTKYGTTLDRTDRSHNAWLQHMAEELLDGAGYALAAQRTKDSRWVK